MTQQIQGTFLSFNPKVTEEKGNGKVYDFFKVRYRDERGRNQEYSGFANGLKYNRKLAQTLSGLNEGDQIILIIGENKAGFKELQNVSIVSQGAAPNSNSASTGNGSTPESRTGSQQDTQRQTGRAPSTYETAEERAKKQVLIVKQSSLGNAIDILRGDGKKIPSVEDVISTAEQLFDWVYDTEKQAKPEKAVAAKADSRAAVGVAGTDLPYTMDDDIPF